MSNLEPLMNTKPFEQFLYLFCYSPKTAKKSTQSYIFLLLWMNICSWTCRSLPTMEVQIELEERPCSWFIIVDFPTDILYIFSVSIWNRADPLFLFFLITCIVLASKNSWVVMLLQTYFKKNRRIWAWTII